MPRSENRNDQLLAELGLRVLKERFTQLTFERLLCRPKDAIAFCRIVRDELGGVDKRSDEDILWTLLNRRKMGRLSNGKSDAEKSNHPLSKSPARPLSSRRKEVAHVG